MPDSPPKSEQVRLQKVLAAAGYGSRRHCEEFIRAGRVSVDGETVQSLGISVDPRRHKILVDGELVRHQKKRYFILNKPAGYLCTNADPSGRRRVSDLFPQINERLFTVGRLDENSEGLLIVTNDGELSQQLAHPRYGIPKTYEVQVAGVPSHETLMQLKRGIHFSDGKFRVKGIRKLKRRGKSTFLQIVLTEGRNREIRRLLARVGHKVIHLKRLAFGPLKMGHLGLGRYRELKPGEVELLRTCGREKPDDEKKLARPRRTASKRKTDDAQESRPPRVPSKATNRPAKKRASAWDKADRPTGTRKKKSASSRTSAPKSGAKKKAGVKKKQTTSRKKSAAKKPADRRKSAGGRKQTGKKKTGKKKTGVTKSRAKKKTTTKKKKRTGKKR